MESRWKFKPLKTLVYFSYNNVHGEPRERYEREYAKHGAVARRIDELTDEGRADGACQIVDDGKERHAYDERTAVFSFCAKRNAARIK